MRKLSLDVEAIAVESFDTIPQAEGEGTVRGNELLVTPGISCAGTCAQLSCFFTDCC